MNFTPNKFNENVASMWAREPKTVCVDSMEGAKYVKCVGEDEAVLSGVECNRTDVVFGSGMSFLRKETEKAYIFEYDRMVGVQGRKLCTMCLPKSICRVEKHVWGFAFFAPAWWAKQNPGYFKEQTCYAY